MADVGAVAAYRRMLARTGQSIVFRRVTGQAPNVVTYDATVLALFRNYTPSTSIGEGAPSEADVTQGLREFIVLDVDLATQNFPLPLAKNDKIILGTEAYNIVDVDYGTRVFAGAVEGKAIGV